MPSYIYRTLKLNGIGMAMKTSVPRGGGKSISISPAARLDIRASGRKQQGPSTSKFLVQTIAELPKYILGGYGTDTIVLGKICEFFYTVCCLYP